MRRFFFIISATALVVVTLAYWEPLYTTVSNLFSRPFKSMTDEQIRTEITTSHEIVASLGDQGLARARAGADTQAMREIYGQMSQASERLRQLKAERSFREDQLSYALLGAFALSVIVFFFQFRGAYRESMPGERDREKARVRLAHDSRENTLARDKAALADRLGRIDPRLLKLKVGHTDYKGVVSAVGRPARSEQDRGVATLTYLFEIPRPSAGEVELAPERLTVLVFLREGVVAEIRVEPAAASRPIAGSVDSPPVT